VRRLLLSCPLLEVLDLLEIPRLGNRALEAPLPWLRVLAAGSLGRPAVAESSRPRGDTNLASLGGPAAPLKQRQQGSAQFTSALISRLAQRPPPPAVVPGRPELRSSALTHAILPHCAEIEVLPKLPQLLQHLDLRGANLQVPEAAVAKWRPLAGCTHLTTLCLAGNALLSAAALLACVGSLPEIARLQVLDLSGTRADAQAWAALPKIQPALTHLRVAGCVGLQNSGLALLLAGLLKLQALDVASCGMLEQPFADVLDGAAAAARGAAVAAELRLLGVGQTDFAASHLEATRRSLAAFAPAARVLQGSLDLLAGYAALPPALL